MHGNVFEFCVKGPYALFSDPATRLGGQKTTYQVPTYEALKGIAKSVFWKPTIVWHVDAVRVMRQIRLYTKGVRPIHYQDGGNDLAYYTYLDDVEYQVRCHFEWNMNRAELAGDRNADKYRHMIRKYLDRGGRRNAFLGTSECTATVEPCVFGSGAGYYDGSGRREFGLMVHGLTYADEAYSDDTAGALTVRMWEPVMHNGVIEFVRPERCPVAFKAMDMGVKKFSPCANLEPVDNLYASEGGVLHGSVPEPDRHV